MKRISDEEIDEAYSNARVWHDGNLRQDYLGKQAIAQAQLESCEKEHNEVVREIFEEIESKSYPQGKDIYGYYIWESTLSALKEKYATGSSMRIARRSPFHCYGEG